MRLGLCVLTGNACVQVKGISWLYCIFSVRAIHLIQEACDQMERLINPHAPDPVCQSRADCQYGANAKQRGKEKLRK